MNVTTPDAPSLVGDRCLQEAWQAVAAQRGRVAVIGLLVALFALGSSTVLWGVGAVALMPLIEVGLCLAMLRILRGLHADAGDLMAGVNWWGSAVVLGLLLYILNVIAVIAPAVIVALSVFAFWYSQEISDSVAGITLAVAVGGLVALAARIAVRFFVLYSLPLLVLRRVDPIAAIVTSAQMARRNPGGTLLLLVVLDLFLPLVEVLTLFLITLLSVPFRHAVLISAVRQLFPDVDGRIEEIDAEHCAIQEDALSAQTRAESPAAEPTWMTGGQVRFGTVMGRALVLVHSTVFWPLVVTLLFVYLLTKGISWVVTVPTSVVLAGGSLWAGGISGFQWTTLALAFVASFHPVLSPLRNIPIHAMGALFAWPMLLPGLYRVLLEAVDTGRCRPRLLLSFPVPYGKGFSLSLILLGLVGVFVIPAVSLMAYAGADLSQGVSQGLGGVQWKWVAGTTAIALLLVALPYWYVLYLGGRLVWPLALNTPDNALRVFHRSRTLFQTHFSSLLGLFSVVFLIEQVGVLSVTLCGCFPVLHELVAMYCKLLGTMITAVAFREMLPRMPVERPDTSDST